MIAFIVEKNFDANSLYMLYYRFDGGKIDLASAYHLKKMVYGLKMENDILYMHTKSRVYKIFPKGDELEYEVE